MKKKQKISFQDVAKEIIQNWKAQNNYLGIKRFKLEGLSKAKSWKIKKTIALIRKEEIILLHRRYYFVNKNKIKELDRV